MPEVPGSYVPEDEEFERIVHDDFGQTPGSGANDDGTTSGTVGQVVPEEMFDPVNQGEGYEPLDAADGPVVRGPQQESRPSHEEPIGERQDTFIQD